MNCFEFLDRWIKTPDFAELERPKLFAGNPVQVRRADDMAQCCDPRLTFTADEALRWLDSQAKACRDRDTSEAFCLLLPALLRILKLPKMDDTEAAAFRQKFKLNLK